MFHKNVFALLLLKKVSGKTSIRLLLFFIFQGVKQFNVFSFFFWKIKYTIQLYKVITCKIFAKTILLHELLITYYM